MFATIDVWRLVAVLVALAAFGFFYNLWVASLEERGHDRGYMGFIVAGGCLIVIAGWFVITGDLAGALVLLAAFAAAGVPMMYGSIQRHVDAQERAAQALRDENARLLNDGQ